MRSDQDLTYTGVLSTHRLISANTFTINDKIMKELGSRWVSFEQQQVCGSAFAFHLYMLVINSPWQCEICVNIFTGDNNTLGRLDADLKPVALFWCQHLVIYKRCLIIFWGVGGGCTSHSLTRSPKVTRGDTLCSRFVRFTERQSDCNQEGWDRRYEAEEALISFLCLFLADASTRNPSAQPLKDETLEMKCKGQKK